MDDAASVDAAGDGRTFAVAESVTNWLPREVDVATEGSAEVTGGHALSVTGGDSHLLDRWTRGNVHGTGWSMTRDARHDPLLEGRDRHFWSIDVDGEAANSERQVSRPPGGNSEQVFTFNGKGSFADALNVSFKGESVELVDHGGEEIAGFWLDNSDDWRKGTSSDFQVSLGVLEDRLRFTTRHGFSRYQDRDMSGEESGNALVQRIDADVLQAGDFHAGLFGSYARTDVEYTPLKDMLDDKGVKSRVKDRDKRGAFADPGHERTKFGGIVGYGPIDFTLASVSESAFAGDDEGDREVGYQAKLSLAVDELRGLTGAGSREGLWVLAPHWVWASYDVRDVDVAGSTVNDASSFASIGAAWQWKGAYLNVDYWRLFLDSRQPGAEESDWMGDGLGVSLGYYQPKWSIYSGLSGNRSDSTGVWSQTETGYYGWLTFSVKPDDWPDLKLSGSSYLYNYEGNYGHESSDYGEWTLGAELDFSKYLIESPRYDMGLKMVFQLDHSRHAYGWEGDSSKDVDTDVFVGLRYEMSPKR